MQTLSQIKNCHEQKSRDQLGNQSRNRASGKNNVNKLNLMQSVGRFLKSMTRSAATEQSYNCHSLSHLSEHQLRDIGFTRESAGRKLPDANLGYLQHGLYEQRRTLIHRLPKG